MKISSKKINILKTYSVEPGNELKVMKSIPKKSINERKAKKLAKDVGEILDRYYVDEYCLSR